MPVFLISFLRRAALLTSLLVAGSFASQAQLPGNGGTTGGPPPPGATAVPLDGGATLLLASGVAYGLRRLRARRAK
ncbi:MAG: PID-CTERM protein-sorting domain-containing protein [Janthinobacterium lividum]